MRGSTLTGVACCLIGLLALSERVRASSTLFRPPAVPLITHDPYFSAWSFADRLTDDWSKHWTGANHALCGIARIDGKPYRFMGVRPKSVPAMRQVRLQVLPTRTVYTFEADGVELQMTFLTPALPYNLEVLSRPVTYILWQVCATDGKRHEVSLYLDASAEWAVNTTCLLYTSPSPRDS